MSAGPEDPTDTPGPAAAAPGDPAGTQPSEAELRAAYEAELARVTSTDMILQTAVSLLNLGSFKLAPAPPADPANPGGAPPPGAGQDLEQARDAIDAVRALLEILERRVPSELGPLRQALSQLQMVYAREAQAAGGAAGGPARGEPGGGPGEPGSGGSQGSGGGSEGPAGGTGGQQAPSGEPEQRGPGPAESSGRLWVPGR
ncbi:MAG TPA: hypothetical protein VMB05_03605 [Solirubrobacteraceae bacterium]|nr:hypothetical protein [Solirubrobacteraceae bacterium]